MFLSVSSMSAAVANGAMMNELKEIIEQTSLEGLEAYNVWLEQQQRENRAFTLEQSFQFLRSQQARTGGESVKVKSLFFSFSFSFTL
jgi:hypothetical protein